jgi:hypothetical protein
MAQVVEHLPSKQEALGSITKKKKKRKNKHKNKKTKPNYICMTMDNPKVIIRTYFHLQ